jgi:lipopolysaccharide transport system permease protein
MSKFFSRHDFDLLTALTLKEIKIRYKNSYLGYLWSLANPLMLATIFYFVFQSIMRIDVPNYALFLVSGLFVWQWLSNSLSLGTMLFVGNAGLIKKVRFKRHFLAIAMIFSEGFNFAFSIPVIAAFMIYYDQTLSLTWLIGIPLLFVVTGFFIYGWALFLGSINLFFRDLERIIALLMTLMFYATPVMYPVDKIPEAHLWLLNWNPFSSFVIMWRDLFLFGQMNWSSIFIASIWAAVFTVIGVFVYNQLKPKFAELI